MTRRRLALGAHGEELAARHLVAGGMVLLDRNWHCEAGELDLVLRDGDVLVVCEVKTRTSVAYGSPFEAVTPAKLARLRRLGARWVTERRLRVEHVRIDMVGVLCPRTGPPEVEHVAGIG
ncbi:MAG: YraN family protein [Nocardioides alkalitolerans]